MSRRLCLAAALLALAAAARADGPPSVKWVRVGLPSTGKKADQSGRSRNGSWAPVVVHLESASGHAQNAYRLRIETTDVEEQTYQYVVPVPGMSANNEASVMGYTVPGSDGALFRVILETTDETPRVVSVKDKISRDSGKNEMVNEQDVLFLGAGGGLSTLKAANDRFDKALEKEEQDRINKEREKNPEGDLDQGPDPLRGKRQFAFADEVGALPDRWFGYGAADVVVLTTGKLEFVSALASGDDAGEAGRRRAALQEWVRRGGQLVLSVGTNTQAANELLRKMPVVRAEFAPAEKVKLPEVARFSRRQGIVAPLEATVAPLKRPQAGEARTDFFAFVTEGVGPVVVEAPYGLGRVLLVCFDLDSGEFAGWAGRDDFWKQVQTLVSPYLPVGRAEDKGNVGFQPPPQPGRKGGRFNPPQPGFDMDERNDMRTEFKRTMELFEDVPTISFGWVALFLLLFIALVGPLDYILLKKVFKRLELTWVTFPLIVLGACVAAYFGAYSMKGEELRVNKVDLIEVDLHQPNQVYVHSWFTLFSPRAQSYTVGIDPSSEWAGPLAEGAPGPVVTLLEGGDNTRRQASQALFDRPYQYAEDATALKYVPVPVWSTRSFTADFRAPLPRAEGKDRPPIGTDDKGRPLSVNANNNGLVGTLTNNLPVTLKDVCLFYKEKWYLLGDLAPQQPIKVEEFFGPNAPAPPQEIGKFFAGSPEVLQPGRPLTEENRAINAAFPNRPVFRGVKELMFYEKSSKGLSNGGLRSFDQSWRLGGRLTFPNDGRARHREEVILVARAPMLTGRGPWVNAHAATGSRLWLGKLPSEGGEPPALTGVVTQETFLRVYVPVRRER